MRRLRLALAALFIAGLCFAPAAPVLAVDVFKDACESAAAKASAACQTNGANPFTGPNGTLQKAANIISWLAGVSAALMLVIAGLMYVLSNGDSSKISTAKTTVIYAIVGIVIVVSARAIIIFFVNKV